MPSIASEEIQEILRKHQRKLSSQIKLDEFEAYPGDSFSQDYKIFRRETLEQDVAWYERLCAVAERLVHMSPTEKDREKLNAAIEIAHLNVTPEGAVALGVLFSTSLVFFGLVLGGLSYVLLGFS